MTLHGTHSTLTHLQLALSQSTSRSMSDLDRIIVASPNINEL